MEPLLSRLAPSLTTAVILNFRGEDDVIACINGLHAMPDKPRRTIIVDNASGRASLETIQRHLSKENIPYCCLPGEDRAHTALPPENIPCLLLSLPENNGYAAGNNAGLRLALTDPACRAFWILNNDTQPRAGALQALCHCLNKNPGAAMAGSTLVYAHAPETLQCAGGFVFNRFLGTTAPLYGESPLQAVSSFLPNLAAEKLDYISGASLLLRRIAVESLGFFAEEYFLYYEDTEFGLRARKKGWQLAWAPESIVLHKEGGASGASAGGAGRAFSRSKVVDYLMQRNRMYLMRAYFPQFLPIALAGFAGVVFNRIRRGQSKRIPLLCKGLWDGLRKNMGKPRCAKISTSWQGCSQGILFITSRADFGGGPEHLWQLLAQRLPEVRPFVACPEDYPYYERFRSLVGQENLFLLPHRRFSLRKLWRLRAFCGQNGISLLHSHGKGAGLYGRFLALLTGLPCVHTFHGVHMGAYGTFRKKAYRLYERCMSFLTRVGISVSDGERRRILNEGLMPEAKLRLVPNGVSIPHLVQKFSAVRPYAVVSITRFDLQKNSGFVIDVMEELKRRRRLEEFYFVLIGDGPDKNAVAKRAQTQTLDGALRFISPTKEPHAAFEEALCYFSSSRWEGMPLAVLEAMAHGLPPVLSAVPGNTDAVQDGETGLLYPAGNAAAAAAAICRLADEPLLRARISAQARAFVALHHDVRQMARRTFAILASQ